MGRSEDVIKMAAEEIRTIITTDRVVGTPITIGDATILPLVSVGFGFGGGGGSDTGTDEGGKSDKAGGPGSGEGVGAGGGVKPVALVISDASGVRVEPIKAPGASLISSITDIVRNVVEERSGSSKRSTGSSDSDEKQKGTSSGASQE